MVDWPRGALISALHNRQRSEMEPVRSSTSAAAADKTSALLTKMRWLAMVFFAAKGVLWMFLLGSGLYF